MGTAGEDLISVAKERVWTVSVRSTALGEILAYNNILLLLSSVAHSCNKRN